MMKALYAGKAKIAPGENKRLELMPHTPKWMKRAPTVINLNMTLAVARRDRNGLSLLVMGQDALRELIHRYDPFQQL